jgi:hypothetical protein
VFDRYLPAPAGTLVHDADRLPSFLRNPARSGVCFGVASVRAPAAGRVDREGFALSSSHDVVLRSVVASWVTGDSTVGVGPTCGGGRKNRRVAGSGNVTDMVPSLDRGAAHGLFASGPADYLHAVSHVEPEGGRPTAAVCASVSSWIALVRPRIWLESPISSSFCCSSDWTIRHS